MFMKKRIVKVPAKFNTETNQVDYAEWHYLPAIRHGLFRGMKDGNRVEVRQYFINDELMGTFTSVPVLNIFGRATGFELGKITEKEFEDHFIIIKEGH